MKSDSKFDTLHPTHVLCETIHGSHGAKVSFRLHYKIHRGVTVLAVPKPRRLSLLHGQRRGVSSILVRLSMVRGHCAYDYIYF